MNATDVVTFVNKFVDAIIPSPPRDFLDFQKVEIYICPAGVQFGTKRYPQGFSFIAQMVLFGKYADIECGMSKDSFVLLDISSILMSLLRREQGKARDCP